MSFTKGTEPHTQELIRQLRSALLGQGAWYEERFDAAVILVVMCASNNRREKMGLAALLMLQQVMDFSAPFVSADPSLQAHPLRRLLRQGIDALCLAVVTGVLLVAMLE